MECLFRFYSYGLEKAFSAELYRDFEETTLKDFKAAAPPRLYGLEKVGGAGGWWRCWCCSLKAVGTREW